MFRRRAGRIGNGAPGGVQKRRARISGAASGVIGVAYLFSSSNFFMKSINASMPSIGIAL